MLSPIKDNKNAFDLLRLLLASGVIIAHAYLLGGYTGHDFLNIFSKGQACLADLCVMGFFVLSGYLITASYQRSGNLVSFIIHRILRIYPGFWVCLLVTGFGFTWLISILSNTRAYTFTGHNSSFSYFYNNIFTRINQWSVGGVLSKNAYTTSINGSLWSLYPEVQCYLLTLALGWFGLFNKHKSIVLGLFALVLFVFVSKEYFNTDTGPTFLYLSNALMLYAAYLGGTTLFLFKDYINNDKKLLISVGLATLLLLRFGGFLLLSPLLISYLLIYFFQSFTVTFKYDVSFGVYIYGFPIQQALYLYFGNRLPVLFFILISLSIALVIGFLSFILVERHFIRFRKPADNYLKNHWPAIFKNHSV